MLENTMRKTGDHVRNDTHVVGGMTWRHLALHPCCWSLETSVSGHNSGLALSQFCFWVTLSFLCCSPPIRSLPSVFISAGFPALLCWFSDSLCSTMTLIICISLSPVGLDTWFVSSWLNCDGLVVVNKNLHLLFVPEDVLSLSKMKTLLYVFDRVDRAHS